MRWAEARWAACVVLAAALAWVTTSAGWQRSLLYLTIAAAILTLPSPSPPAPTAAPTERSGTHDALQPLREPVQSGGEVGKSGEEVRTPSLSSSGCGGLKHVQVGARGKASWPLQQQRTRCVTTHRHAASGTLTSLQLPCQPGAPQPFQDCDVCTVDAEEVARRKALAWWEALEPEQRLVEQDWQARLSPLQFRVLRQRQTEDAGSGEHVTEATAGSYACAGCALPLYHSRHKFPPEASVHGWPAFGDNIDGRLLPLTPI
jgi:hypothetical protein